MTQLDVIFHLGSKFGELSRQIEMVLETQEWRRCQNEIRVDRVSEGLICVLDHLMKLDGSEVSEKTQEDIKSFLEKLMKKKIKDEKESEEEYETILSRIKTKFKDRKQKRKLKPEEVKELDVNLKIWKDRIINELARLSKKNA